jgi:hypothetical protein
MDMPSPRVATLLLTAGSIWDLCRHLNPPQNHTPWCINHRFGPSFVSGSGSSSAVRDTATGPIAAAVRKSVCDTNIRMRARFLIWVACVVLFAYLPLWYAFAYDYLHSTEDVIDELIGKGDLALIASAIMADGFGRVLLRIKSDQERPSGYVLGMLVCSFLVIVACLILYAAGRGQKPSLHAMKVLTIVIAVITTVTSGSVILFVEAGND